MLRAVAWTFFRDALDGGDVGHLFQLLIVLGDSDFHLLTDGDQKLEGFGDLFFGEEVDLQVEVIADIAAALHAVLFHEDEGTEEDAFDGDDHGEEDEGIGIEAWDFMNQAGVDEEPGGKPEDVDGDEAHAAGEAADDVGDAVHGGAGLFEGFAACRRRSGCWPGRCYPGLWRGFPCRVGCVLGEGK